MHLGAVVTHLTSIHPSTHTQTHTRELNQQLRRLCDEADFSRKETWRNGKYINTHARLLNYSSDFLFRESTSSHLLPQSSSSSFCIQLVLLFLFQETTEQRSNASLSSSRPPLPIFPFQIVGAASAPETTSGLVCG